MNLSLQVARYGYVMETGKITHEAVWAWQEPRLDPQHPDEALKGVGLASMGHSQSQSY
jgi:hypothetical protein